MRNESLGTSAINFSSMYFLRTGISIFFSISALFRNIGTWDFQISSVFMAISFFISNCAPVPFLLVLMYLARQGFYFFIFADIKLLDLSIRGTGCRHLVPGRPVAYSPLPLPALFPGWMCFTGVLVKVQTRRMSDDSWPVLKDVTVITLGPAPAVLLDLLQAGFLKELIPGSAHLCWKSLLRMGEKRKFQIFLRGPIRKWSQTFHQCSGAALKISRHPLPRMEGSRPVFLQTLFFFKAVTF